MMLALLIAVATPGTAIDAERAFSAAAQREGQWTAYRQFAAADATMFMPQPVRARAWLRNRRDPSRSVRRQPVMSFVSCDGMTAVNTGPWQRPDGSVGYFTTVWHRQPDGEWKWLLDFDGVLPRVNTPPPQPEIVTAFCREPVARKPLPAWAAGGGTSPDGSLRWWYTLGSDGRRTFAAEVWDGRGFHPALADQEGAATAP